MNMDKEQYEKQVADYMEAHDTSRQEAERQVQAAMTDAEKYFIRKRKRERW